MRSPHDKFFYDVYSVISQWEFIILRIQTILLWERVVPSFVFTAFVHLVFLSFIKSNFSTLFIFCLALFLVLLCNLLQPLMARFFLESEVVHSEHYCKCGSPYFVLTFLFLDRCKISYPCIPISNNLFGITNFFIKFFIISSSISIGCIVLSMYVSGVTLAYIALNICLILPTLLHHRVISRVWDLIKPILKRIEAEFDKNPLESPEERDAGERELYEPIVEAANAANSSVFPVGFLTDVPMKLESNQLESEELDNSEAVFIKQFVSDISSEELDRLFSEALGEHETAAKNTIRYNKSDNNHNNNSSEFTDTDYPYIIKQETVEKSHSPPILWAMESEYATDDDESSDIMGEVYPSPMIMNKDVEHEGFVFVRKQE
ncbi:hypothetical protein Smp_165190 [Schistosoma mansoni]|uniref:hypothetical protein n=1 Tax=Schistosoma mansoni TaxID=6183 RepID=UPI0001A62C04|nr:hypothetical protein Smp_165190 [Schistosoma mansoni]|eukprot:XP_018647332.1 hypothetical protein Smp_165190 [Schistosoma mansoni]